jgi:hypothetical protein
MRCLREGCRGGAELQLKAKDMKSVEAALNHMLETEESEAPLEPVGSPPRSIGAGSVCRALGPRHEERAQVEAFASSSGKPLSPD